MREDERSVPLILLLRLPVMPPYGPKCRWGWFFKTIEPKPLCPVQKIYGETRGENGTERREGKTVRRDERGKRYGETRGENGTERREGKIYGETKGENDTWRREERALASPSPSARNAPVRAQASLVFLLMFSQPANRLPIICP